MARSNTSGLPFLIRRPDTGKFTYHRDLPAYVAPHVTGAVSPPWSKATHPLAGRATVKITLRTGDEGTARIRWTHVHAQVEDLVRMGEVVAAGKEQRRQAQRTVERLPAGAVGTIRGTGQARPPGRT